MNPEQQSARPKKKGPGTPNKRTRKDEAEEDKEMLQVAAAADEEEVVGTIRISGNWSWWGICCLTALTDLIPVQSRRRGSRAGRCATIRLTA
jgi:hypothetical protein